MITNLQNKLNRLASSPKNAPRPKHDVTDALGGTLHTTEKGGFIIKIREYPIGMQYGDLTVENIENLFPHVGRLVFIDTETSGLSAASCPFLIGAAYYDEDKLVLEQIFMRDIDDEQEALNYVVNKFSGMTAVTFNGKSFDIPLIKSRCVLNSVNADNFALQQIDLLHMSRRIWKKRLESCRLGSIEEEILKFEREHDISGSLVPDMYKRYLETGRTDEIIQVIEHNEMDVVSLSVLLGKLLRIEEDPVSELENILDVMHLGEFYFNHDQFEKARECLEAVIHTRTNTLTLYNAMKYLSLIHKRQKEWDKAVYYWIKMDKVNIGAVFPLIELAKYYEHTEKNIDTAYKYAEKAKLLILKTNNREALAEINIRMKRLNSKLNRSEDKKIGDQN